MKLFNDTTQQVLERALDLRFKNHGVAASNVANANTPNYRARQFEFKEELRRLADQNSTKNTTEMAKTNPRHLDLGGSGTSRIKYDNSTMIGADGNNVDLDKALGEMSGNARGYAGTARLLSMKLRVYRLIARGGGV